MNICLTIKLMTSTKLETKFLKLEATMFVLHS